MDYGLEGRVAVITGAASGIGRATTEAFAAMGARVVAAADADAGDGLVSDLGVRFVAADVAQEGAVGAVVRDAVDTWGRIDCAANCAGVGGGHASTHGAQVAGAIAWLCSDAASSSPAKRSTSRAACSRAERHHQGLSFDASVPPVDRARRAWPCPRRRA